MVTKGCYDKICNGIEKKPGIYFMGVFDDSGKLTGYVGGSINIYKRLKIHLSEMRVPGYIFHEHYKKKRFAGIVVMALEYTEDILKLNELETKYINKQNKVCKLINKINKQPCRFWRDK